MNNDPGSAQLSADESDRLAKLVAEEEGNYVAPADDNAPPAGDPGAADLVAAPSADKVATPTAEEEAAALAAAAAANPVVDAPAAGTPDPTNADQVSDGKGGMIPKARFDEVVGQRNDALTNAEAIAADNAALRERIARLEATQAAIVTPVAAPVARDFDAEHTALQQKYDEGDLTVSEFMAETRKLQKAEFEFTSQQRDHERASSVQAAQTQAAVAVTAGEWKEQLTGFLTENPQFASNVILKREFQEAVNELDDGKISSADLLYAAHKTVCEARGLPLPVAKAAAAPNSADELARARHQRNIERAGAASGAPARVDGSVSSSATAGAVDVLNLGGNGTDARDAWSALDQRQQDKALGITN